MAAAAVGLPVAALAQSGVEVYGVVDAAVTRVQGGGAPSQWRVDSGGLGFSHLGLRVSEALAPQLWVKVALEHGFAADTGTAADPARRSFDRQAWIGMASPVGDIRFGRQISPQHEVMAGYDIFGGERFGSVLANTTGHTERFDDLGSLRVRVTRAWSFRIAFAPGEQPPPIEYGRNRYVMALEHERGPWRAALATVQQNSADTFGKIKSHFVGLSREVGTGHVHAAVFRGDDNGGNVDLNLEGKYYTAWSLSFDQRWRERWTFGALVGAAVDTGPAKDDARQVSLLARYALSPRTSLYAVAARLSNGRGARLALGSSAPAAAGGLSGLQFGLRHGF